MNVTILDAFGYLLVAAILGAFPIWLVGYVVYMSVKYYFGADFLMEKNSIPSIEATNGIPSRGAELNEISSDRKTKAA